jgi:hypothetical protein
MDSIPHRAEVRIRSQHEVNISILANDWLRQTSMAHGMAGPVGQGVAQ